MEKFIWDLILDVFRINMNMNSALKTEAAWIFDYQISHQRTMSIAWNTIARENSSLPSRDSKTNSWQIVLQWPLLAHSESPCLLNAIWYVYIFIRYCSYWTGIDNQQHTVPLLLHDHWKKWNGISYSCSSLRTSFTLLTFLDIVLQILFFPHLPNVTIEV